MRKEFLRNRSYSVSPVPLRFKDIGRLFLRVRLLRDRLQHVRRCGVVTKGFTHVDKEIFIPRRKYKTAAKLQRIFSQAMLLMSGGLGAAAGLQVISTKQVEQGSVAQADGLVGFAFVVDQQWELDSGFFTEESRIAGIAQSDSGQAGALPLELFFEFAQLRDMLSAEDSTVVAKKDQHGRSALPQ
ncbi:MAG: hypothetical protein JWN42_2293 [Candidatus Angelobacter sp.]|nr:hypothetical protein [Candidatus Angelobacter sp.]